MNKLLRWSILIGIICVWILVYSIDTTTWSDSVILWFQTIIPMIMTVTGLSAFFKWDKIIKTITSDDKDDKGDESKWMERYK